VNAAAYTSRSCRVCDHESEDNRKTQAVFACVGLRPHGERRLACGEEHRGARRRALARRSIGRGARGVCL